MSEDRPQYPRDTVPTNAEIAERLRRLSADIHALGCDMHYVGGFGKLARLATAMYAGAGALRTWADEIEEGKG